MIKMGGINMLVRVNGKELHAADGVNEFSGKPMLMLYTVPALDVGELSALYSWLSKLTSTEFGVRQ